MVKIYKAKPNDTREIKQLLFRTWLSVYSGKYSPQEIDKITSVWHSAELLGRQISDPDIIFLVAKDGNKIVGMGNATISGDGEKINIQRLHVDPSYQHRGTGTKLLNALSDPGLHLKIIDLEVEKQNTKAILFYKKNGFKISGEKVIEEQGVKMPCYIMEKII